MSEVVLPPSPPSTAGFWVACYKERDDKGYTFESLTPVADLNNVLSPLIAAANSDGIDLVDLCICYFPNKAAAADLIAEIGEENIEAVA